MIRNATTLDLWRITRAYNVPGAARLSPCGRWRTFRRLQMQRRLGPCSSLWEDGRLCAVGGLCETVPGVAEAWAVVSPHAGRKPLRFVRTCRAWLDRQRYRRISASVADLYELHAFCHLLGFACETKLHCADAAGGPVYIYARFKEVA